jgi:hypothetical protein
VRNACRHAQASRVEVAIQYGDRHFRLRIRDNGKGIDPKILAAGGRTGHHGLPGMQERARLARGGLTILSKPESGTEIELTIPATLAYVRSRPLRRSMASGKEARARLLLSLLGTRRTSLRRNLSRLEIRFRLHAPVGLAGHLTVACFALTSETKRCRPTG